MIIKGKDTEETEEETTEEETTEEETTEEETEEEESEADKLKRENEELRAQLKAKPAAAAPVATPDRAVTSDDLMALSPDNRKALEEQYGESFENLVAKCRHNETRKENATISARLNVSDMLDEIQDSDPSVARLRVHMKKYLEKLPLDVRASKTKLAAEIEWAKTFARGAVGGKKTPMPPETRGKKGGKMRRPTPDADGADDGDEDTDEIKPGDSGQVGNFKLTVSNLASDEVRKRSKHPTDPQGVQFDKNYDEAPRFK